MASTARQFARAALRTTTQRSAFVAAPRQAFRQGGRRFNSTQSPKKGGASSLLWLGAAAAAGGAGYYLFTQANGSAAAADFKPTQKDYQEVYNTIAKLIEEHDDYEDGSYGPILLRLAWHASGTYDVKTGTGGSNGATMRFAPEAGHGANAGLKIARDFLEPVKQMYPWITYSDLWILAGVTAVQEMQGKPMPYRPGRVDGDIAACTPDGRLPDASQTQNHLRDIFYRMGFNDQEIVALSGAHALGRTHRDRSGYEGPWTFSPTVLTNDFFTLLLSEKWQWKKWDGPDQYEDKATKSLMMLPSDMALIQDKEFRKHVERYAKDSDLFLEDFSKVVTKLFELGVPFPQDTKPMTFKPLNA